jgi:hypothetical protein
MTGLPPEQRFENHKRGIKAARIVKNAANSSSSYAHLNLMPFRKAREIALADGLRKRGCRVFSGH